MRRWKWAAPLAVFTHVVFLTGGVRDGRRGLYYGMQRMIAEAVLSLELIEGELERSTSDAPDDRS